MIERRGIGGAAGTVRMMRRSPDCAPSKSMYENRYLRKLSRRDMGKIIRDIRHDDYRKRLRDKQVDRLMRQYGLSREYARTVVELVYRRAG